MMPYEMVNPWGQVVQECQAGNLPWKSVALTYAFGLRQDTTGDCKAANEAIRERFKTPNGEPPEWKKEQWYRHVENGATKWVYSAQCLQQDFYAEVTDTGKQFRWEVGFDSVADAGYTRSLSTAMHKAVDVYEDLTGPKQKETEGT